MDYVTVTETPGDRIRPEALAEMFTRYAHARDAGAGKDVLEVACGSGSGLGLVASKARSVVGGEYSAPLAASARRQYGTRIPIARLDAQRLPFRDASFDVVLLYEAVYYLASASAFFDEARRTLRPDGLLLVCSTNCEWSDFNPSPFSTRYFSAAGLRTVLAQSGFQVDVFGAFPAQPATAADRLVSVVRRAAVALKLVPRTMKGKTLLKRLFYGRLVAVPSELATGEAPVEPLVPLSPGSDASAFQVLYAFARVV